MSVTAAFSTTLAVSGTPVAMTAESTTNLGSQRYQVTNTAKRILDPDTAIVVKDGGVAVPVANYSLDLLFGIVTFSVAPAGTVTLDAAYVPTSPIADGKSVEVDFTTALADATVFGDTAKKKLATLLDLSGSIGRLAIPLEDLDGVAVGTQSFDSWMRAGTPRLIDINFGTGGRVRAWVLFTDYSVKSQVEGLVEVDVKFTGAAQAQGAAFSIGT